MNERDQLDVLHVFCSAEGRHGNAVSVLRDARRLRGPEARQALAAEVGRGETVFVDDPERGSVDVHAPGRPLPFAVAALIGAAWLLDLEELNPPPGPVWGRSDGEFTWITVRADWAPPCELAQYASPAEVDALAGPPAGAATGEWWYAWAWEEEAAGRVRARAFRPLATADGGVDGDGGGDAAEEDEATGTAALVLTDRLGRALNITQGRGSQILTAPGPGGEVELGGRVRLVSQAPVLVPVPPPAAVPARRLSVAEALRALG
ncbi:PhzF family phenazine biosynthesis protein [Streptomyces sp. NPDC048057]|uniref:PhzF family phenazine biosynthesis protein n=1 Tax=Streptomyces sp. NPDC048057 TaxID=3155628 RepID=UPI0033CDFAA9